MKKYSKTKKVSEPKPYNIKETEKNILSEPEVIYGNVHGTMATRTIGLMGMQGKRDFTEIKNENDFIRLIRAGIPKQAMNHLMEIADISLTEMALIVHTSDRTLRRYSAQQKLSQEQSERMIELAKLYSRGEEVFGTISKFKEWMDTTLLPFGNKKPKAFLDTSLGIQMIVDELGRIEHGVLA
jgi:putative toxin-antitoxin system antitoxin component (TIGR02293 family)